MLEYLQTKKFVSHEICIEQPLWIELSFYVGKSMLIHLHVFVSSRGKDNLLFFDLIACGKMGAGVFVDGCPTTQVSTSALTPSSQANS